MTMNKTRIKICGMTSIEDAQFAAYYGVDAIGVIFHEASPRNVQIDQARAILDNLPPFVSRVGVFANADFAKIQRILDLLSLDILQFHGQEPADFCRIFNKPYIKTIHVGTHKISASLYETSFPDAIGFLFDTYLSDIPGGSGTAFDWQNLPHTMSKPVILAGGLTSENVQHAILQVRPFGVDVTSGVEISKGKKDRNKVKAFIDAVRNIAA